jgi:hypothetical protein
MFDTYLTVEHGDWRIRRLDLLAIDSMNAAVTGLPGDRATGWRLALGLDEERVGCTDCRVARAQGDVGIGHAWRDARLAAALHLGGGAQAGAKIDGWGFARIGASLVYRPSARFGVRLAHELRRPFRQARPAIGATQLEARLSLGTEYDVRLRWVSDTQRRVMLALGRYW